jgi:hypothetical protein
MHSCARMAGWGCWPVAHAGQHTVQRKNPHGNLGAASSSAARTRKAKAGREITRRWHGTPRAHRHRQTAKARASNASRQSSMQDVRSGLVVRARITHGPVRPRPLLDSLPRHGISRLHRRTDRRRCLCSLHIAVHLSQHLLPCHARRDRGRPGRWTQEATARACRARRQPGEAYIPAYAIRVTSCFAIAAKHTPARRARPGCFQLDPMLLLHAALSAPIDRSTPRRVRGSHGGSEP